MINMLIYLYLPIVLMLIVQFAHGGCQVLDRSGELTLSVQGPGMTNIEQLRVL
jgi:hypothetical protein